MNPKLSYHLKMCMRLGVEVKSEIGFWQLRVICHSEIHAVSAILYMATRKHL